MKVIVCDYATGPPVPSICSFLEESGFCAKGVDIGSLLPAFETFNPDALVIHANAYQSLNLGPHFVLSANLANDLRGRKEGLVIVGYGGFSERYAAREYEGIFDSYFSLDGAFSDRLLGFLSTLA